MNGFLDENLKMIWVMLNRVNKKIYYGIFVLSILTSCKNDYDVKTFYFKNNVNHALRDSIILNAVTDTIRSWIKGDLKYFHKFKDGSKNQADWKVDKWIFLNSKEDKCLINLLVRTFYNSTQDDVYFILGEKYHDVWWFYLGPDLIVPQENYAADQSESALPFSLLSDVARRNALNWYFLKKESGTCVKEFFSTGYSGYKKCNEEKYLINDQYFETEINVGIDPDPKKRIEWYLNEFLKSKYESN